MGFPTLAMHTFENRELEVAEKNLSGTCRIRESVNRITLGCSIAYINTMLIVAKMTCPFFFLAFFFWKTLIYFQDYKKI